MVGYYLPRAIRLECRRVATPETFCIANPGLHPWLSNSTAPQFKTLGLPPKRRVPILFSGEQKNDALHFRGRNRKAD